MKSRGEKSQKRKDQKKEDADARKGRKVAIHCVFPMICGSGGSKSRLAKAAGAEASELCFFLLSGSVYSCAAYATVYAMPTRPQWEPTRLIALKVCLRRPNARIKRRHSVCFCLRRHTFVCFWKVGNGTFAYATTVPSTFLLSAACRAAPCRGTSGSKAHSEHPADGSYKTYDYAEEKTSDVFDGH